MAGLRITVLHGAVPADAPPDERDVLDEVAAVREALAEVGHRADVAPMDLDLDSTRRRIAAFRPDLLFNLVESVAGRGAFIHLGPVVAESLGLPYTGAPLEGLFQTSNKLLAKHMMRLAGVPTPPWVEDPKRISVPSDGAPWIVKSAWEHASVGIDDDAVGTQPTLLDAVLKRRRERYGGSWFAERYVEGREVNVALIAGRGGPELLPPAEIRFEGYPRGKPRIVGYRAKWLGGSFEYDQTKRSFDFGTGDDGLLIDLGTLATRAWNLFALEGYARVDFRVDREGRPWVLEVNANPCLSPDAGFAACARRAGISYAALVDRLVTDALDRAAARG